MKRRLFLILALCLAAICLFASCTPAEPSAKWITGTTAPTAEIGNEGDLYLDASKCDIYQKIDGSWTLITNIKGESGENGQAGSNGTNGTNGADGAAWLSGSGAPDASSGKVGDLYLDSDTSNVYKKSESGWALLCNIKGENGSDGQNGQAGTPGKDGQNGTPGQNGQDGKDGSAWLSGSTPPVAELGKDGDWHFNSADLTISQKKSGEWKFVCNLKGKITMDKEYSILFIGNSYTFYNDMPTKIFEKIAKAQGYTVKIESITKGGWTLEKHANPSDEIGAKVAAALDPSNYGKYDYVILQEQSLRPARDDVGALFYDGVRNLAERIRAIGAEPILYATWGRKTGSENLATYGWTNESMTWRLAAAYSAIGKELDIDVAFVGLAFYDLYTNHESAVELYHTDLSHPSYSGSYLAAATLYAKIFNADPTEITWLGEISNNSRLSLLTTAARDAVFMTPQIPAEYVVSSEGVTAEVPKEPYVIDTSKMQTLTEIPDISNLISAGITGTKGKVASSEYSTSALTAAQKADIADISYGVSVIGAEKMTTEFKGYKTAVANLANGDWGTTLYSFLYFDSKTYNINGEEDADGAYTALYTLNFGAECSFDAIGFASGSIGGFPAAAEVFVSSDGVNWTRVDTACWDSTNTENPAKPISANGASSYADNSGNTTGVISLFDMGGATGQYVRVGVVCGRASSPQTVNTKELLVFGSTAK